MKIWTHEVQVDGLKYRFTEGKHHLYFHSAVCVGEVSYKVLESTVEYARQRLTKRLEKARAHD